jgi:hypothetical protein
VAQTGAKGPPFSTGSWLPFSTGSRHELVLEGWHLFFPLMPTPPRRKTSKKINENDKNFKFQNPLIRMYLTQPTFMKNLKFRILIFFAKKSMFQIKTAITFTYGLEKTYNIWKTIYAKSTSDMAVCTNSCFSKFQREIWKHEDFKFCQKKFKIDFFENFEFLLLFLLLFSYFEVFILFWNF